MVVLAYKEKSSFSTYKVLH